LVFPFAKVDKARLLERVPGIRALGTTPIAYPLQQIPGIFGNASGEKIVILVTDGIEECKGNLSAVVADLLAKGFKARLNIVGFALANRAAKQEMQRLAELTEGHFFDAKNGKGLREAIEQALAIPYDVFDASGAKVRGGLTGQGTIEVPEGIYTVIVQTTGKLITIPEVRVTQNGLTKVELKKAGQEIGVQVVGP
jgi:von Willebrand factor type A domain